MAHSFGSQEEVAVHSVGASTWNLPCSNAMANMVDLDRWRWIAVAWPSSDDPQSILFLLTVSLVFAIAVWLKWRANCEAGVEYSVEIPPPLREDYHWDWSTIRETSVSDEDVRKVDLLSCFWC